MPKRRGRAATRRSLHTGLTARTTGIAKVKRSATIGGAMPLRAIAYVSEASRNLTELRLQQLVAEAVQFNESVDVTGTLLFDGSRFLQYLEGPSDGLASVKARVANATRHEVLHTLAEGRVPARWFPRWTMANREIEPSALSRIIDAPWDGLEADDAAPALGFPLLLRTWTGDEGELEPAAVSLGS